VALPGYLVTAAPATVPLADAAAPPLAGVTALQALRAAELTVGEPILVIGAAGAVGGLAVQLARRSGAYADALVSRPGHETPSASSAHSRSGTVAMTCLTGAIR
jgi:NADPH:quinone reductase-like Zn-dependent oxidoreductase